MAVLGLVRFCTDELGTKGPDAALQQSVAVSDFLEGLARSMDVALGFYCIPIGKLYLN